MKRPQSTASARLLARFIEQTERMSFAQRALLVGALLVGSLSADGLIGAKASMNLFYVVVSFLGGWCFGQRGGALVALTNAALITGMYNLLGRYTDLHAAVVLWNLFVRVCLHLLYAGVASGLRQTLENERWLASYDALTGALNVRAFHERMEKVIGWVRRDRRSLLLAYVDLDGFKGVNDRFGHAAGDRVLQSFATAAVAAVRQQDLFARVGGDEFAVVMAVAPGERGEELAELLHERLTAMLADSGYSVTCSMGAVVLEPEAITSADAALARADALMYEVKESGRNALRLIHLGAMTSPAHALAARVAAAVA